MAWEVSARGLLWVPSPWPGCTSQPRTSLTQTRPSWHWMTKGGRAEDFRPGTLGPAWPPAQEAARCSCHLELGAGLVGPPCPPQPLQGQRCGSEATNPSQRPLWACNDLWEAQLPGLAMHWTLHAPDAAADSRARAPGEARQTGPQRTWEVQQIPSLQGTVPGDGQEDGVRGSAGYVRPVGAAEFFKVERFLA